MLNSIIGFSIRNKLIVGMGVVVLIIWGAYSITQLPIDAVPDITDNQVMVITSSPSLGASDIERQITFPVEQSTRNIPGIIEQRSFSRFGLSIVTIVFDDNTDVYWARQQVSERLLQVQAELPEGLGTPELAPVTTGLGEIFQYVVKAKPGYEGKYSAMELRTIQDWIVRRQLLGTEGVADVSSFGGYLKQYEIAVDPARLKAHNLSITDIFSALAANNQNTGGAYIEKGPALLYIRSEGLVRTKEEIESVLVSTLPDGSPLLIHDLAEVKLGSATRYGAMTYNDQGEVAGAVVMMLKGGNSSEVIERVKERIEQIKTTLPEGVEIEAFLDRTKMVNNAISTVETNLLEGALIVVFVLVLFLGNLRAGFLVASVIPLAMLFAVCLMNLFGVSGNLMSLGALDFGLIIDGAVIIVEAVMHRMQHFPMSSDQRMISRAQMDQEVKKSAGKMMNAAVFGQAIILIVYLPILTLRGIEGKMFRPMAETVAFAIAGAFLLSLTYVPMMSALFLSRKISHKKTISDRMMAFLERVYRRVLEKLIRIPRTLVLASAGLFIIAVIGLMSLGGEFIPELEEGDFAVDTRVLTGSSLNTTIDATQKTAGILLRDFPEVEKVVAKIGSGEIPTDPMPIEASDLMVILKPKDQWTSAKTFDELAEKMSKSLSEIPGVTTGFQYPVQMRFNELMTGSRQDVVCKIFGENLDSLARYATLVGEIVNEVDGAKDLYVETVTGLPQIVVEYNREALAQYSLSVEEVNKTIEAAFAGAVSGQVYENERRFDLVVRLNQDSRKNLSDVQNLLIATPKGMQIPLQQVANVSIKVGPNQIQRENAQRRISIGFNVRGRDVETVVKELQEKIGKKIKLPPAYFMEYGGQFENLTAAKKRLAIAVPGSLLLIFVLLYFAFKSVRQGLLIYSAIPLSAIGGVFALLLRGMPFSISAGVGFIALFGVAVLNGIVLITEFNLLKASGITDISERIFTGTRTRLRPVLMTAAVASLGFLPMAMSNGSGAEVQRPLATVVIGGLISATLLTLLILPALYLLTEKISEKAKNKKDNMKPGANLLLILFVSAALFAGGSSVHAQTITLPAAIDSAMKQNPAVLAAALHTQAQKQAEKSAWDVPHTTVSAEFGKVNSPENDTRFGLSQSFAFPSVYHRQKQILTEQTAGIMQNEALVRLEVRKRITEIYYRMLVLGERKKLLLHADSLYADYLLRQEQRFQAGDADVLEQASAESQRMQVALQLKELDADFVSLQIELAQLLNTKVQYVPAPSPLRLAILVTDSAAIVRHPSLLIKQTDLKKAFRQTQLERSRLMPQFVFGYYNQSFAGWQFSPDVPVFNTRSIRYSSVMFGIEFPLFARAGIAHSRSSRFLYQAAGFEYSDALAKKKTEWQQLKIRQNKNADQLAYYESSGLKQAQLIEQTATGKMKTGAISYYEWMMLMNQAITIRSAYLSALDEWNSTASSINSITNN